MRPRTKPSTTTVTTGLPATPRSVAALRTTRNPVGARFPRACALAAGRSRTAAVAQMSRIRRMARPAYSAGAGTSASWTNVCPCRKQAFRSARSASRRAWTRSLRRSTSAESPTRRHSACSGTPRLRSCRRSRSSCSSLRRRRSRQPRRRANRGASGRFRWPPETESGTGSPKSSSREPVPDALVLVEAAARLAAEQARVRHRDKPRRRRHPRLAELLPQRLARVDVDVDTDEVDELARPHRPAGPVLHPRVEILGRHARLVENADAVVEQRDEDPVDDEAGRVVTADRMLPELLRERVRGLERLVGAALGADDLDEGHQWGRVEEVHAHDALRRRDGARDLGDGQGGRVGRENGLRAADALELGKELPLRSELLDDRLDHDVAIREVGDSRGRGQERDVIGLDLALLDLAG